MLRMQLEVNSFFMVTARIDANPPPSSSTRHSRCWLVRSLPFVFFWISLSSRSGQANINYGLASRVKLLLQLEVIAIQKDYILFWHFRVKPRSHPWTFKFQPSSKRPDWVIQGNKGFRPVLDWFWICLPLIRFKLEYFGDGTGTHSP